MTTKPKMSLSDAKELIAKIEDLAKSGQLSRADAVKISETAGLVLLSRAHPVESSIVQDYAGSLRALIRHHARVDVIDTITSLMEKANCGPLEAIALTSEACFESGTKIISRFGNLASLVTEKLHEAQANEAPSPDGAPGSA